MTNTMTTEEMIEAIKARNATYGTSVRCPICNAGRGKHCRIDMSDTAKGQSSRVIRHAERVALAQIAD